MVDISVSGVNNKITTRGKSIERMTWLMPQMPHVIHLTLQGITGEDVYIKITIAEDIHIFGKVGVGDDADDIILDLTLPYILYIKQPKLDRYNDTTNQDQYLNLLFDPFVIYNKENSLKDRIEFITLSRHSGYTLPTNRGSYIIDNILSVLVTYVIPNADVMQPLPRKLIKTLCQGGLCIQDGHDIDTKADYGFNLTRICVYNPLTNRTEHYPIGRILSLKINDIERKLIMLLKCEKNDILPTYVSAPLNLVIFKEPGKKYMYPSTIIQGGLWHGEIV